MTRRSGRFLVGLAIIALGAGCASQGAPKPLTPANDNTAAPGEPGDSPPALPAPAAFDQRRAYVSSIGDGVISEIDLEKNQIAWTLRVSEGAGERKPESAMGIAASPDGKWVYTGDVATNEVVFVNADAREIARRIRVPHQVHAVDIGERGRVLWVAGRHPDYPWLGRTTIIDARAQKILRTFTPGLGNDAHYAFTPDLEEVWGASVSTNLVSVYDAQSGEVLAAIPLSVEVEGTSPEAELGLMGFNEVAISPGGDRAYVVGPESGTVFAIDVRAREPLARVKVGDRTHGVAVTRDGREVWTANNAGTVTILDAASLDVLETIRLHDFANQLAFAHLAFSYDGTRAYVSFASDIAVIDVMTREPVSRIEIGTDPHEISLEDYYVGLPDGQRVTPGRGAVVGAGRSTASNKRHQESRAAGITVGVTLRSSEPAGGGEHLLSFDVSIDTHSRDLTGIDVARQVSVQIDGRPVSARSRWTGESESSHHRSGTLDLFLPAPPDGPVSLVFEDIGVDRRTLRFGAPANAGER